MTCETDTDTDHANHVFDVQIGYMADDEGRDWLITACKCGVRQATLLVSQKGSIPYEDVPVVIKTQLLAPSDDGLL